ncbi:MAG: synthase sector subunit b [Labilithrix sp.]|jgi:F-type H+-transporting ATPase subunit b|nr:synthase sector subunit b [Labilithrix sp.]
MSLLSVSTTLNAGLLSSGLSEGGGVTVDLDASLLVQIVLFVVLLLILKPLLFEPMLKLFEEREKRIEGTRREASKEDERSAKALAKYEAVLAKAREAGAAERDALRAEGLRKEAEIMAGVRSVAAATIEQGRAALANEAKKTRTDLSAETAVLGRTIASRVLGREVSQ